MSTVIGSKRRDLMHKIWDLRVEPGRFVPRNELDHLLENNGGSVVRSVLNEGRDPEGRNPCSDDIVKYILDNARLLFCMIVIHGKIATAAKLVDYHLTDDYLPVRFHKEERRIRSLRGAPRNDEALEWFTAEVQGFDSGEYDTWKLNFRINQWMFLAPIFRSCEIVYPLHMSCPLPFTGYRGMDASGATCNLAQADIHKGHCKIQTRSQTVAVKTILTNDILTGKIVQAEVAALDLVKRLQHKHLIKFIATYSQQGTHHLMFEWADGGNLKEFWHQNKPSSPSHRRVIKWAVEQIAGLAEALCTLHNPDGEKGLNCRHGDLKPENIVLAIGSNDSELSGILQITDMGLAKVNDQKTMVRQTSGTVGSTIRYQPPEFKFRSSSQTPTSRSFDIWSMGCIILEFVVWLLYGKDQLSNFVEHSKDTFFANDPKDIQLEPIIQAWIKYMGQDAFGEPASPDTETANPVEAPACISQALRDILKFVKGRLLVANTALPNEITDNPYIKIQRVATDDEVGLKNKKVIVNRATSKELVEELQSILNHKDSYFFEENLTKQCTKQRLKAPSTADFRRLIPSSPNGGLLQLPLHGVNRVGGQAQGFKNVKNTYALEPMPDVWAFYANNELAFNVFPEIRDADVVPQGVEVLPLCEECSNTNSGIFTYHFIFTKKLDPPSYVRESNCGVCKMLLRDLPAATPGRDGDLEVRYIRRGSYLAKDGSSLPAFSLIVGPGISAAPNDLQRSFPRVPDPGSEAEFALMKTWLADCDENHKCSAEKLAMDPGKKIPLPTRLIFVGNNSNLSVKLVSMAQKPYLRYIALSYRWKYFGSEKPLLLTDKNKEEFEGEIELNKMPQTFQDAVKVTRGLGVKYLWIDSLCIIQDNKDDWDKESQRMKDVYNGAYCTISATCAESTYWGFLKKRPERRCIGINANTPSGKEALIYICEAMDNFEQEVEQVELHTRGWIFQERALSRRTLHFAKKQVYLECGDGVCSETLTKLFKRESFFLSDANFPKQALSFHKGMKIKYYETIYQKYSKLSFSNSQDRAVAMEGLESKILEAYQSGGQFGLLHDHFDRSIMWQRDGKNPMKRIGHINMEKVPSLSWMKVEGAIKYLLPIDTERDDESAEIKSPWGDHDEGIVRNTDWHVEATVRDIFSTAFDSTNNHFYLDRPEPPKGIRGLKYIFVASQTSLSSPSSPSSSTCYVLLVVPKIPDDPKCTEYERAGVAKLLGSHISRTGDGEVVTIV